MIQYIVPTKSQFSMNDCLTFDVQLDGEIKDIDTVKIQIYHLNKLGYECEKKAAEKLTFKFVPSKTSKCMEGYFIRAFQLRDNKIISQKTTACDRAADYTYAPRYGFLSDFCKEEINDSDDAMQLNMYHINVVQFYDWMYRHDDFFPKTSDFEDIMGKKSSMDTVKQKIESLHKYGTKAFAYGAVYGAEDYQKDHQDECLYDGTGKPMKFIDKIYFMDINRDCEWHNHIIKEYSKAIDFGFDGIHMDQYGFPKESFAKKGKKFVLRSLRDDFPALINDTKNVLGDNGVIFNAVNNWPIDTVSKANEDCVYIEVWGPNDTYADLKRLIDDAKKYAPNKNVILAAYLLPFSENPDDKIVPTALLTMATIFSSGGFHLLLGEKNGILTKAYYSDYCHVTSKKLLAGLKNYYDFITAYEELLFDKELVDETRTHTGGINDEYLIDNCKYTTIPEKDNVFVQIKSNSNYKVINLVNFLGIDDMNWNSAHEKFPREVKDIKVNVKLAQDVEEVFVMSPDYNDGQVSKIEFEKTFREDGNKAVCFNIPKLNIWDVVVIKVKNV